MIEVENLDKNYGAARVLRGVSFRALPGEIAILTGDNGAGKSTLLRVLAGLSRPSGGTAKIAGRDAGEDRLGARANLSFLPQGLTFHPAATPEWLVRFYASIRRRKIARDEAAALLARFELLEDRRKPVHCLSGGMVQRLGLALLLLPDAPVLLLDEPVISLDPGWRARLAGILRDEAANGKTILLTTHLPNEWEGEAHQHLCCRDGGVFPADAASPSPIRMNLAETNPPLDTRPGNVAEAPSFRSATTAFAKREFRMLLRNRFLLVFFLMALAGGFAATGLAPSVQAIPFILLQVTLYLVPLFGVLIGLSSAHGELEEQPFLFSQPVSRFSLVAGKFGALATSLAAVLFLAFLPSHIHFPRTGTILLLWGMSLLLGSVFVALGLAIGCSTRERTRGIVYALVAWLFLLIAFDLLAYGAALVPWGRQRPLLWLTILLMNPADAVRVAVLFQLEDIPFTIPADLRLANLWMERLLWWVFLLCLGWIALLLLWSRRSLERTEL